jgi:hypothetical protein
VLDTFFPDAREKLVGPRPDYTQAAPVKSDTPTASSDENTSSVKGGGWSKLIDAETIETEIKRLAQDISKTVTTPAPFKAGSYKECRRDFSLVATLFAVAAEFDGDVRWKDSAAVLRDSFARAGHNCKVGTDQSFQEATQRKQDLADLIAGNRPATSGTAGKVDWPQVADRSPLMQRLEIAQKDRLAKWLVSKQDFTAHRDDMKHESQLMATLADVITREGYEFWDDDTYTNYARELKQSGLDLAAAIDLDNYDHARAALTKATTSCTDCHEGYRQ